MPTTKYTCGDIFAVPVYNEHFVFGRVMLDVSKQCIRTGLIETSSPLQFFGSCLLVEMYNTLSAEPVFSKADVLIPGVFIDARSFKSGLFKVVGHKPVDPAQVEFPEALASLQTGTVFQRGEVCLPVKLSSADLDRIHVYPTITPSLSIQDHCLFYMGKQHLVQHQWADRMNLEHSDLRFAEFHRKTVYKLLDMEANEPYNSLSRKMGFAIERFHR